MKKLLPFSFVLVALLGVIVANLYLLHKELGDFYNLVIEEETARVKSLVEGTLAGGGDPVEAIASYMQSSKLLKGATFSLEGREIIIPGSDVSDNYYKVTITAEPFKFTLYYDFHYVRELNKHIVYALLSLVVFTLIFITVLFAILREYYKEKILLENERKEKDKLESINLVIHSILHEVKNRLNAFRLLLYKVEKECKSSAIDSLKEEIINLSRYVEETANLRKPLKLVKERIDLKNLIEATVSQFRDLLSSREIEINLSLNNCVVTGDREKLKSVVVDLLKNAIEAIGKNGKVEVVCEKRKNDCILEIKDSAVKPFDKGKIFSPFYSTKKNGFGLGLYNVKRIVKAHGGEVEVFQTKDRTVFRLIFPIS